MLNSSTTFIEPAWKLLLSNKVLLAKLWQKHPNHPLLLPAYFSKHDITDRQSIWVKKTDVKVVKAPMFLTMKNVMV